VYSSTEQKCAENVAIHDICSSIKSNKIDMFVFRIRRVPDYDETSVQNDPIFEISFSRPCSVCRNMLKAISRNGLKIRIKWSTGNINNLVTPYININDLKCSIPSSGTRRRYRRNKQ